MGKPSPLRLEHSACHPTDPEIGGPPHCRTATLNHGYPRMVDHQFGSIDESIPRWVFGLTSPPIRALTESQFRQSERGGRRPPLKICPHTFGVCLYFLLNQPNLSEGGEKHT